MSDFYNFISGKKDLLISDLDNCFSDSREVQYSNWEEFETNLVKYAKPNFKYIKNLINYCRYNKNTIVFFVTARENTPILKEFSITQIIKYSNGFFCPQDFDFSNYGHVYKNCYLYMRSENDFRKPYQVKLDIFKEIEKEFHSITTIIDDDYDSVKEFTKAGYRTILYNIHDNTYKRMGES